MPAQSPPAQIAATKATGTEPAPALASSRSKDARARRSGQALRQALLTLLATSAFDHISIRDICVTARVHYATFFRHFPDKDALLADVARQQISDLNTITLKIRDAADYVAGFEALCRYVDDHRALWATLLNGGAGGAMREEWLRQARTAAARESHAASWLPADLSTICASTLIAETLAWWLSPAGQGHGVREVADILLRLMTTPLIAKAPGKRPG